MGRSCDRNSTGPPCTSGTPVAENGPVVARELDRTRCCSHVRAQKTPHTAEVGGGGPRLEFLYLPGCLPRGVGLSARVWLLPEPGGGDFAGPIPPPLWVRYV